MSGQLKTYRVDVIHVMHFGVEVEVRAKNKREARKLARDPSAEIASGDGYNWDRQDLIGTKRLPFGICEEVKS